MTCVINKKLIQMCSLKYINRSCVKTSILVESLKKKIVLHTVNYFYIKV